MLFYSGRSRSKDAGGLRNAGFKSKDAGDSRNRSKDAGASRNAGFRSKDAGALRNASCNSKGAGASRNAGFGFNAGFKSKDEDAALVPIDEVGVLRSINAACIVGVLHDAAFGVSRNAAFGVSRNAAFVRIDEVGILHNKSIEAFSCNKKMAGLVYCLIWLE